MALDMLFTFNIALSIVIMMSVFYVSRPVEFGVFPTVLLRRNPVAPRAERCLHARCASPRPQRSGSRGPRDPSVRRIRDRRQLRGRCGRVRHSDHHQLRGRHQGLGPYLGSQCPIHLGLHARQADGHRRRSECRPHHAGRGTRTSRRRSRGSGLLRLHGRCQQVRPRRCRRGHPDYGHQHRRWPGHRHDRSRDADRGSRQDAILC